MGTYVFDDGSTIDTEWAGTSQGATPATNGSPMDYREAPYNPAGAIQTVGGVTGAPSWADLMKGMVAYGVPRAIDNAIAVRGTSQVPPSQYVRYTTQQGMQPQQGGGGLLLIAAAAAAVLAFGK